MASSDVRCCLCCRGESLPVTCRNLAAEECVGEPMMLWVLYGERPRATSGRLGPFLRYRKGPQFLKILVSMLDWWCSALPFRSNRDELVERRVHVHCLVTTPSVVIGTCWDFLPVFTCDSSEARFCVRESLGWLSSHQRYWSLDTLLASGKSAHR